ncbi:hypothetical protein XPA_003099 [Xanthoria parietina]
MDQHNNAGSQQKHQSYDDRYLSGRRSGNHVGHDPRVQRSAINNVIEDSPYAGPWHQEQSRQRQERSGVTMGKAVPEAAYAPTQPPKISDDVRSVAMLLDAAKVVDQNVIPCTSPDCPVTHPHGEGPYLFEGEVPNSELANRYFSPSVPPPAVVKAFNALDGMPSLKDLDMKDRFYEYHTVPCRPSKHLKRMFTRDSCIKRGARIMPLASAIRRPRFGRLRSACRMGVRPIVIGSVLTISAPIMLALTKRMVDSPNW